MRRNTSSTIRTLRNDFVQFVNCNDYALTQEIFNHVQGIISALDSLKLENVFLASSTPQQSDQGNIKQEQSSINILLDQGSVLLKELMMSLNKKHIADSQENDVRKANYVANEKLKAFLKKIHPFSYGAYSRLNNYAMTVGLNDRYSTIRNELNVKEPKNNLETFNDWAKKTNPSKTEFKTPDWRDYTYGFSHSSSNRYNNKASSTNKSEAGFHYTDTSRLFSLPVKGPVLKETKQNMLQRQRSFAQTSMATYRDQDWRKTALEAGISLEFPGISEQKYRYVEPKKENYLNFVINPHLNISLLEKPFGEALQVQHGTEYGSRFKMAHENQIDKFPWIK